MAIERNFSWGLVGLLGCGVLATGALPAHKARHQGYLSYRQFQSQPLAMTLPTVPRSMVQSPPASESQPITTEAEWPRGLLKALYRKLAWNPSPNFPVSRAKMVQKVAQALDVVGPARSYVVPHALALYWMYGSSLQQTTSLVPVSWAAFLAGMERRHRPYRSIAGPFSYGPEIPLRVPGFDAWTIAVASRPLTLRRRDFLSAIIVVLHQNRLWIFFSGEPKDLVAPYARVPSQLVPKPPDSVACSSAQAMRIIRSDFEPVFSEQHLKAGDVVRLYHGHRRALKTWLRKEWQRLDSVAYGYNGSTAYGGPSLHDVHGVLWGELRLSTEPTVKPQAGIYLMAGRHGWVAIAAGANDNQG